MGLPNANTGSKRNQPTQVHPAGAAAGHPPPTRVEATASPSPTPAFLGRASALLLFQSLAHSSRPQLRGVCINLVMLEIFSRSVKGGSPCTLRHRFFNALAQQSGHLSGERAVSNVCLPDLLLGYVSYDILRYKLRCSNKFPRLSVRDRNSSSFPKD